MLFEFMDHFHKPHPVIITFAYMSVNRVENRRGEMESKDYDMCPVVMYLKISGRGTTGSRRCAW